ncbi:Phosphoglucomutase-2 [Cichlidogyrus casuarinus]|uniref:Phosphoglucomutase-2 n=1 Tax=Cichlidogyrus casuarinus TaxID=1844966 RepID=A0ABD2QGV9_9PLAT
MSAKVFADAGNKVYLSQKEIPTPYVAFSTKYLQTKFGVVITASHNPKNDNGYKVYACNGAQIVSPIDKKIADCIQKSLEPLPSSWDWENVCSHPCVEDKLEEIVQAYTKAQLEGIHFNSNEANAKAPLSVVYSAMHGVGFEPAKNLVKAFGFSDKFLVPVLEQCTPDPDFPTVTFPNPEERTSLALSKNFADQHNLRVIFANDPDADRLAIAEKKSTVSSKILKTIAKREGFNFIETLTGFKWMGNKTFDLYQEDPQNKVIFAFEEAIGFMCGDAVLDKDGVSALAVASELVVDAYSKGETLYSRLDSLFDKYGLHLSNNGYYICHEKQKTDQMFSRIRDWPGSEFRLATVHGEPKAKFPSVIGNARILAIRDLTVDFDDETHDKRAILPVSTSSHAITFQLDNGVTFTLRTSGTEPKIKFYSELISDPGKNDKRQELNKFLTDFIEEMVELLYEPKKNNFIPQE